MNQKVKETKTTVVEKPDGTKETIVEEKREKSPRVRWFMLVLYPDNPVHCDVLEWLKTSDSAPQGFYIEHEPDYVDNGLDSTGDKKKHWHVVLYYPNQRTEKGVRESFGKCHVVQTDELTENGTPLKKAVKDTTGYDSELISVDWIVGKALCSAITSVHDTAIYLLHKNYESMKMGKKEYAISDIKAFRNDTEIVQTAFELEKVSQTGSQAARIIDFIDEFDIHNLRVLFKTLYLNGEVDLIKYAESHAYLIKNFM